MGAAFQTSADMLFIQKKSIPAEFANIITIVEQYQSLIRRGFNILREEASDLEKEDAPIWQLKPLTTLSA